MFGKLAAIVLMRKTASARIPLFQRLLVGVTAVLTLALLTAFLVGTLIVGCVYFIYQQLVEQGIEPGTVLVSLAVFIILLIVAFGLGVMLWARRVRDLPKEMLVAEAPIAHRVNGIVNAFVDGLLTHSQKR